MRVHPGSRLVTLAAFAILGIAAPRVARAQVTDAATCPTTLTACTQSKTSCCTANFVGSSTSKAIIIPMDRCHQQPATTTFYPNTTNGSNPDWCANWHNAGAGNGMNYAYGLVFRLMQQNVPVYWIVNPTKAPTTVSAINATETEKDVDFWVMSSGKYPVPSGSALTALVGTAPVQKLTTDASNNLIVDTTWGSAGGYQMNGFPVRGSAFLIAPADRPAFETFWKYRPAGRTGCGNISGANCYDFTAVQMYQVDPSAHFVWQDFTKAKGSYPDATSCPSGTCYYANDNQLPVAMKVDYAPPKIAEVGSTQLSQWLQLANLNDLATNSSTCITGTAFSPTDAVGCAMQESDVQSGYLKSSGFTWAWINTHTNATLCANGPKLAEFATAVPGSYSAGNLMFADDGILMAEQCGTYNMLGSSTGLSLQNGAMNEKANQPIIVRYPTNLFSQFGDEPLNFATGTVTNWNRVASATNLYSSLFNTSPVLLRRLMTQENTSNTRCQNHDDLGVTGASSTAGCDDTSISTNADITDVFAYGRYKNNANNGIVFYSPGNQISQNPQQAQLRLVLSSIIATPPLRVEQAPTTIEVSRASPVTYNVGGTDYLFQGTYEYTYVTYPDGNGNPKQYPVPRTVSGIYTTADVNAFTFPAVQGHMRARTQASITTSATDFSSATTANGKALFDASTLIPNASPSGCSTWFSGSCRTVFTNTVTGKAPPVVYVKNDSAGVTALGSTMLSGFSSTDQATLISRVLAGQDTSGGNFTSFKPKLGGVDRSTVAVIPASDVAKPATGARPTMAYFGATDGMLHAVCVDKVGPCASLTQGTELWAFIPRTNLAALRYNSGRIDGSPRVVDMYDDWASTGTKSWKTVLTFQTGTGDATSTTTPPAVYALDVTDPANPAILWEYTTPATRATFDLGVGLTVAAGDAYNSAGTAKKNLTIVQTNNGGTGAAGTVVLALNSVDGSVYWKWGYAYPSPPRAVGTDASVPATGVPGGAVTVDKTVAGYNAFFTDIVVADLYGNAWLLDPNGNGTSYNTGTGATNGRSKLLSSGADTPLFQFTTNFHPIGAKPAIYAKLPGGTQYAALVDGGYMDTLGSTGWGSYAAQHYLFGVSLGATNFTSTTWTPIKDTDATGGNLDFKFSLGSGERGFAQALVVGDQVFVATESSSGVNGTTYGTSSTSTGHVYGVNLNTGASTSAVVAFGASSLGSNGTTLFNSSGSKQQRLGFTADSSPSTGGNATVTAFNSSQIKRKLWLRIE